jgi:hypothetical protein
MPWRGGESPEGLGPFAGFARLIVAAAEVVAQAILMLVRAVAAAVGPGLRWTLRLPVRVFGVFAQLVGLVVVAAIVVLVVVTLLALFAPI